MRVLLAVEPDDVRDISHRLLEHPDVDWVDAAEGVHDAIAREASEGFDLVLCTEGRRINGLALIRRLRMQGRDLPILLIAKAADRATVVEGIQSGCSDYLWSPVSSDALRRKLEKWAGASAADGMHTRTSGSELSPQYCMA